MSQSQPDGWPIAGWKPSSDGAPGAEDSNSSGEMGGFEGREDNRVEVIGPAGDVAGGRELGVGGGGSERDGAGSTVVRGDQFGDDAHSAGWATGEGAFQVDDRADAASDKATDYVETGRRVRKAPWLRGGRGPLRGRRHGGSS